MRLNKLVARKSLLSRRKADLAIRKGQVKVAGKIVLNPALEVSEDAQILINDQPLPKISPIYIAFNKPRGAVCTRDRKQAKTTVYDFLPPNINVVSAGRLDKASRGLLIFTNDGDFLNQITHPRFKIKKDYTLILKSLEPTKAVCQKAVEGVKDGKEYLGVDSCKELPTKKPLIKILVSVFEGRHHLLRRLFKNLGFQVLDVKRVAIGKLTLEKLGLKEGEYKRIEKEEVL